MNSQSNEHVSPPLPPNANSIMLVCAEHSKITGVSVYPKRAEVTRLFKFQVKTGQNQVVINGLPVTLDWDSLRVVGRGAAMIQDVAISHIGGEADAFHPPPQDSALAMSPALSALTLKKQKISGALERTKKSIKSLEFYLASMHVQHVDVTQIGKIVKEYDTRTEELDDRVLDLQAQQKKIDEEISAERAKVADIEHNNKLNLCATIGVFANKEGEVEIAIVYAVTDASWTPLYDIRFDTNTKEEPITLAYKSAIEQSTGEDWNDVPLTLETSTPAFGVAVPSLTPWNIWERKPLPPPPMWNAMAAPQAAPPPAMRGGLYALSRTESHQIPLSTNMSFSEGRMATRELQVSSKGNISATFNVPGLTSIPGDGIVHNLTIVELRLSATMSWVCVPKTDTRMHLNAKIKNASPYTLLSGSGNIYVDGSFVSRSTVPSVSPDESFDCHLGLDPSIRVTYHPRTRKQSQSGRYGINISVTRAYTQHITIFNTKSSPAAHVKIVDQIPVSEDNQIQVNLLAPELPKRVAGKDITTPILISKGVLAMWDKADDPEQDIDILGQDGKLNWECEIPPQGKVNLVLQWEVSSPARIGIEGL